MAYGDIFKDELTRRYWEWVLSGRIGPIPTKPISNWGRKTYQEKPIGPPVCDWIRQVKANRKANPPGWLRKIRSDYQKNGKKNECYRVYNEALREGTIIRPNKCSIDNENCRGHIEGHHEDYDKPLDVEWLCRFHHREVHGWTKNS